ncbi:hypothetical protein GYH30_007855 [Glycine max]|nr:hypothetical protein GYH30_007855 [Glycine max]
MDYTLCKVFFPLMAIRGMALDDYCTLCNAYPETLSHALGDCTWVRGAWNNLGINDTWNFFQHNVHRSLVHDNSARDEFIKALQLHASLESMLHEYPAEDLAACGVVMGSLSKLSRRLGHCSRCWGSYDGG